MKIFVTQQFELASIEDTAYLVVNSLKKNGVDAEVIYGGEREYHVLLKNKIEKEEK